MRFASNRNPRPLLDSSALLFLKRFSVSEATSEYMSSHSCSYSLASRFHRKWRSPQSIERLSFLASNDQTVRPTTSNATTGRRRRTALGRESERTDAKAVDE